MKQDTTVIEAEPDPHPWLHNATEVRSSIRPHDAARTIAKQIVDRTSTKPSTVGKVHAFPPTGVNRSRTVLDAGVIRQYLGAYCDREQWQLPHGMRWDAETEAWLCKSHPRPVDDEPRLAMVANIASEVLVLLEQRRDEAQRRFDQVSLQLEDA